MNIHMEYIFANSLFSHLIFHAKLSLLPQKSVLYGGLVHLLYLCACSECMLRSIRAILEQLGPVGEQSIKPFNITGENVFVTPKIMFTS